MKQQSKTPAKYSNAITELFNKHHYSIIHSVCIRDTWRRFKMSPDATSIMIELSLLDRVERGMYKFIKCPSKEDCIRVYEMHLDKSRLKVPIRGRHLTEDRCISFLKERGYRIFKPEIEYKEL